MSTTPETGPLTAQAAATRCRRCLEWNAGDPWYCPRCGKETTTTPHDGGTLGDAASWATAAETASSAYPHGSVEEQVHRIFTSDQGLDSWALTEEIVAFVRADEHRRLAALFRENRAVFVDYPRDQGSLLDLIVLMLSLGTELATPDTAEETSR